MTSSGSDSGCSVECKHHNSSCPRMSRAGQRWSAVAEPFNFKRRPFLKRFSYICDTLLVGDDGYFNFSQNIGPVTTICCLPPASYQATGTNYVLSLRKLTTLLSEYCHLRILTLLGRHAGQICFSTHLKFSWFFICKMAMSFSTTVRFMPLKKNLGTLFLA